MKDHLQSALDSGVTDLILGSRLLSDEKELQEWLSCFSGRLVAGIDARDGKVAIHGWQSTTEVKAVDMAQKVDSLGFSRIIYTDISRDGTLTGPNLSQLEMVARQTSLPVIASGGVSGVKDIQAVKKLHSVGVKGVIVGKAFYEGNITLEEMSQC